MGPLEKRVVLLSLGEVERTPNGNAYLPGRLEGGEVRFWVGRGARLSWLLAQTLPLSLVVGCLADREVRGRWWVPETASVQVAWPAAEDRKAAARRQPA